jgi:hypothetical protein
MLNASFSLVFLSVVVLSISMQTVTFYSYTECRHAEFHIFIVNLSFVMLSFNMLNVEFFLFIHCAECCLVNVILSVIMLSVAFLLLF